MGESQRSWESHEARLHALKICRVVLWVTKPGVQEGNPVFMGKIMTLALNRVSLKSLWPISMEFKVGFLSSG